MNVPSVMNKLGTEGGKAEATMIQLSLC